MEYIDSASPKVVDLGTRDSSTRIVPVAEIPIPKHLPRIFIYAKKGDGKANLISPDMRELVYGSETFDIRKPYYNFNTVLYDTVNKKGNVCMVERIIPDDASTANLLLGLDVLPTTVDIYERNSDGSYALDPVTNEPIVVSQQAGYHCFWTIKTNNAAGLEANYGHATITPGVQVDPVTSAQSNFYPIMEIKASSPGAFGSLTGIKLWAPAIPDNNFPSSIFSGGKAFPFFGAVVTKDTSTSTPSIDKTLFGEEYFTFTLKPNSKDPLTTADLYFNDIFVKRYTNTTDQSLPLRYGNIGDSYVYQGNIDTLLRLFVTAELALASPYTDFTSSVDDLYLFNLITGKTSDGVPYNTFRLVDDPTNVHLNRYTSVFMGSGSDGTMNDLAFSEAVRLKMADYLDRDSRVQDSAINVDSVIYDSGFPLNTKLALANYIALRKNNVVILSTFDAVDGRILTASEEYSLGVFLRTRLQMMPESDYFGTEVLRGAIVVQSALLIDNPWHKRVPQTIEVASNFSGYMGAGDGKWKPNENFDSAPGSIIKLLKDIQFDFLPASAKNTFWRTGLMWSQPFNHRSYFIPANRGVYSNDTSVLTSLITAFAIAALNRIAHEAWRNYVGTSKLSNAQLEQAINSFIINRTQGVFDDRFIIIPEATITQMDDLRGFSWTLPIKLGANNMKTVMTTYVDAYRASDLQTA